MRYDDTTEEEFRLLKQIKNKSRMEIDLLLYELDMQQLKKENYNVEC